MTGPQMKDALAKSDVVHDRDALAMAIEQMADAIRADFSDDVVPLFVTVMHGGLPFAAQLAFALGERGLDLEFDYLHATRYRGQTSGSGLAWLHRPATPMRDRRVLLADDILDEGHTLLAVKRWCEDQGAGRTGPRRSRSREVMGSSWAPPQRTWRKRSSVGWTLIQAP